MSRKSTKSKSRAPRRKATITVRGSIKAGRDVIMGDQRAYYDYRQQIAQIASPAEFVAALQKLREQIAALKAQPACRARERDAGQRKIRDGFTERRRVVGG